MTINSDGLHIENDYVVTPQGGYLCQFLPKHYAEVMLLGKSKFTKEKIDEVKKALYCHTDLCNCGGKRNEI